jgi:hypothetical protein
MGIDWQSDGGGVYDGVGGRSIACNREAKKGQERSKREATD